MTLLLRFSATSIWFNVPFRFQVICLAALSPSRLLLTRATDSRFKAEAAVNLAMPHPNATPANPWPAIVVQWQYNNMVELSPAAGHAMC